ncbi:hypothetical protein [Pseudomonas sp. MWU12-2323]|uniref:hypothetical protein n=1 Tax=Pseudomonas sp. MWU12-2323 TaxID=2651296 RepID=UPI00128DCC4C|nr:hypothetical protein [Pseudomonas sp. MWU12-2323]MPQ71501.1 hypothetical protein [Pseudomonas sp. MWU12-2323]
MKVIRLIAGIALGAALLTGCNRKSDIMVQPPMAIAPGYVRLDSGRQIQVIGYEHCPGEGYALIGRVESSAMEKHCTIVNRDTNTFDISVGTVLGMVVERWTVLADDRSIKLVRPDGDGATVFKLAN